MYSPQGIRSFRQGCHSAQARRKRPALGPRKAIACGLTSARVIERQWQRAKVEVCSMYRQRVKQAQATEISKHIRSVICVTVSGTIPEDRFSAFLTELVSKRRSATAAGDSEMRDNQRS